MHDLARAFGDLLVVQEFSKTIERSKADKKDEETMESLELLFRLDALTRINSNIGTYLEVNYFKGEHSQFARNQISQCLKGLKKHIIALTYGTLPSEDLVDSMLAPADGDLYNSVVNRIYTAPAAFERSDHWRDLYQK
jgi:hypothetical protein